MAFTFVLLYLPLKSMAVTVAVLSMLYSKYGPGLIQGCQDGDVQSLAIVAVVGVVVSFAALKVVTYLTARRIPSVKIELKEEERLDVLPEGSREIFDTSILGKKPKKVYLWDPSTMQKLGERNIMGKAEVDATVKRAAAAAAIWGKSSYEDRRHALRTLLQYVLENQETIARVSVRDSGKTVVDAMIGEVLTTCEKFQWTINNGEKYLKPESRDFGALMMMKKVYVEWRPIGVIAGIVPWNYPFHNVFNPMIATIMSGNALVLKVSEYASWSIDYYGRIINACLEAAGAPPDLVQFVVGYGETGNHLVTHPGVGKIIFVGSPGVGVKVMEAAAKNLTPVVLELGGKDPFVVCEDTNIDELVQVACRGVWQNMGQNCAGPERFFVYEGCYDEFCEKVTALVKKMKQGPPLASPLTDCGAICMGLRQMQHYQSLVDDATSKGARVLSGGFLPSKDDPLARGSFYPPTVLADVPETADIAQEEIFGPIMCIFKVVGNSDDEAVRMANNCSFALSSCAFSKSFSRAKNVADRLDAGMSAVNDLEGVTYMSQSLPFGGCKRSGFDRFAGPEGLRGLCNIRSICVDRFPMIRNSLPPPLQYPSNGWGPEFARGLIEMFHAPSVVMKVKGIVRLIKAALSKKKEG